MKNIFKKIIKFESCWLRHFLIRFPIFVFYFETRIPVSVTEIRKIPMYSEYLSGFNGIFVFEKYLLFQKHKLLHGITSDYFSLVPSQI